MQVYVLFYGLACFRKISDQEYEVLFPDGRDAPDWGIETHVPHIAVYPRNAVSASNWAWQRSAGAMYIIDTPREVSLFGLGHAPLDVEPFDGLLPALKSVTGAFELSEHPPYVMRTVVRTGTLTAGRLPGGSAVTLWTIEAEEIVTIQCGSEFLKLRAEDIRTALNGEDPFAFIIIGNISFSQSDDDDHYHLYRKLAKDPSIDVYIDEAETRVAEFTTAKVKGAPGASLGIAMPAPALEFLRIIYPFIPRGGCSQIQATASSAAEEP